MVEKKTSTPVQVIDLIEIESPKTFKLICYQTNCQDPACRLDHPSAYPVDGDDCPHCGCEIGTNDAYCETCASWLDAQQDDSIEGLQ